MPDTFDSLRPRIIDYLYDRGIDPRKRFRCLNPSHLDRDPSMGFDPKRNKVHCFACGADYDLFDLLALDNNLSSPADALSLASEQYGDGSARRSVSFSATEPSRITNRPAERAAPYGGEGGIGGCAPSFFSEEPLSSSYLSDCFAHRDETPYFTQRGLSAETVARFRLGYDPKHDCVVLPCEDGRCVRRAVSEKRYLNEKGRPSPLFQPELLTGAGEGDLIFLLEGTFDALSAEELGYHAAALNGSGNREKAAALLRTLPKPAPILLLTDSDPAGETWAAALTAEFPWLYRCPPVPYGKDLNESLCHDRDETARFLARCAADWAASQPPPYKETSAAGRMEDFLAYIRKQAARPPLKTGFPKIDEALDGGLYDGLYVIGAVSSLGKTARCRRR